MLRSERLVQKFNISTCSRKLLDHIQRPVHLDIQPFGLIFDMHLGKEEAMLARIQSSITHLQSAYPAYFPRDLCSACVTCIGLTEKDHFCQIHLFIL